MSVCVPDVKCGVEDVGLFQTIQLDLAVTHLVVHALQLVIQLQLLPFKLAVLLLVPLSTEHWEDTEPSAAVSFSLQHCHLLTLTVAPRCPAAESGPCSGTGPGPRQPAAPPLPLAPSPEPPPSPSAAAALPTGSPPPPPTCVTAAPDTAWK